MHPDTRQDFRRREWPVRTSQVLGDFIATLQVDRISLEDIISALGDRGLGMLIAIFAIPNIVPSTVPFGNVATGLPVIFLAVHLMAGWPRLVLPDFLAKRTLTAKALKAFTPKLATGLSSVERLFKPRMLGITGPAAERIIGALCLLLSIISTLPIPFGHNLPALGLTIIGLGLVEHDGYAILLGAALGLAGVVLLGFLLFGLATHLHHFPHWHR
jgi:hypothetical protein